METENEIDGSRDCVENDKLPKRIQALLQGACTGSSLWRHAIDHGGGFSREAESNGDRSAACDLGAGGGSRPQRWM